KVHAKRKAILDIVFLGERGYGSGVTAAFYSAAAMALQTNKSMAMWVQGHEDVGEETIRHPNGLFPRPCVKKNTALYDRFRLIGRLAGKALLDERLFPLHLSTHFIKLILSMTIEVTDIPRIFLEPGRIVLSLYNAAEQLKVKPCHKVFIEKIPVAEWLEQVDLSFVDPCTQTELVANGEVLSVTMENLAEYVSRVLEIWLGHGIAPQIYAFREGLSEVVAIDKLKLLEADELQAILCGSADVEWSYESLKNSIKLAHGYTVSSEPVEHFINTLVNLTTAQRRAFLLYSTGCPNLPPGGVGFEKLKPPFEVVRRVVPDNEDVDRALPFARTCTNTLHLPAFSTCMPISSVLLLQVFQDQYQIAMYAIRSDQALRLLQVLHYRYGNENNTDMWINTRLSRKLRVQLQDVLTITSGSYPGWCDSITREFKFLFPLELRHMLIRTTAFGCSRSLHWFRDHLQSQESSSEEMLSISPLPKERAKVERADILKSADAVMKVHAKRKAILDIVFLGERGYGSGVTAAFYSAAAMALQT
ncbi:HECT E3 ubiquitin ligase, partial [Thraustotheca clavata]